MRSRGKFLGLLESSLELLGDCMELVRKSRYLCKILNDAIRQADEASAKYQTIGRLLRKALNQLVPVAEGRRMKVETMSKRYDKGLTYIRVALRHLEDVDTHSIRYLKKALEDL